MLGTLRAAVGDLPDRQQDIVRRYYLDGSSDAAIAVDLGLTTWQVARLRTSALASMRRHVAAADRVGV